MAQYLWDLIQVAFNSLVMISFSRALYTFSRKLISTSGRFFIPQILNSGQRVLIKYLTTASEGVLATNHTHSSVVISTVTAYLV